MAIVSLKARGRALEKDNAIRFIDGEGDSRVPVPGGDNMCLVTVGKPQIAGS
jgi:hypothetical protein